MSKKDDAKESDNDIFRSLMRGIKPIKYTKVPLIKSPPVRKRAHSPIVENDLNPFPLYGESTLEEVSGDDLIEFHRGGLQHKVLRKLRRGQYNAEATLDMHGMRVNEAREIMSDFILHCLKNDVRHVIIIHGKGHGSIKPILKNKLNQWLRQIEPVLAFCSASPQDGRSGAVYVLLKGSSKIEEK